MLGVAVGNWGVGVRVAGGKGVELGEGERVGCCVVGTTVEMTISGWGRHPAAAAHSSAKSHHLAFLER